MNNSSLIISLALATLVIVVLYLVVQRFRVSKAKDEHHHSAITKGRPDQRNG